MGLENMNISPELREKAKACKTPEEMLALAKASSARKAVTIWNTALFTRYNTARNV